MHFLSVLKLYDKENNIQAFRLLDYEGPGVGERTRIFSLILKWHHEPFGKISMLRQNRSSSIECLCSSILEHAEIGFRIVRKGRTPPSSSHFPLWSLDFEESMMCVRAPGPRTRMDSSEPLNNSRLGHKLEVSMLWLVSQKV